MAQFGFKGSPTYWPVYGAHYLPGYGTSVADGYTYDDTGDWTTPSHWQGLTGYPGGTSVPGAGDDVVIGGSPAGSNTPVSGGPTFPIVNMSTGATEGEVSGYYYYSLFGDYGSSGFQITGATGMISTLEAAGLGTLTLVSLNVTTSATFSSFGPVVIINDYPSGPVISGLVANNETIAGGTLTTPLLTLSVGTSLVASPLGGGTPDPVADAGSLTITAALSGAVTRVTSGTGTAAAGTMAGGTVSLDGGSLAASTELDVVGLDGATSLTVLAATGGKITAGAVIIATGATGYGSASVAQAAITLAGASTLTASATTGPGSLVVGDTGDGILVSIGANTITDQSAVIANAADSNGIATLDGGTWTNAGFLSVGNSGVGTLRISDGATLSDTGANGNGFVGGLAGSDGSMATVTGMGTSWELSGYLVVGEEGDGTLVVDQNATVTTHDVLEVGLADGVAGTVEVQGGATLTSDTASGAGTSSAVIGGAMGSDGQLDVAGAGSTFDTKGAISVGYAGDGTATVSDGGTLQVDSDTIRIGRNEGSTGDVIVTGQDSNLTGRDATLYAGFGGVGSATIEQAGALSVMATNIGGEATGDGLITLDGKNTTAAFGTLTIGEAGQGTVHITAGAMGGTHGALVLAEQQGSTGTLTLADQDSTLMTSGDGATIGAMGDATVTVGPGATLDASLDDVTIAEGAGSVSMVTLTGDTSTGLAGELDASTLTVGGRGDATLNAVSGATVSVDGDMTVAEETGSSGDVAIENAGTGLSVGGDLVVGGSGDGALTVDAMMANGSVSGKTTVAEQSDGRGTLAVQGGEFDATGELVVGGGGNGLALVQLGGALSASGGLTLGESSGSTGELDVIGTQSQASVTGSLVVGSSGTGTLDIQQAGGVQVTGGVTVADKLVGNAQVLSLDTDGQLTLTGDLAVGGSGIAGGEVRGGSQLVVGGTATIGDMPGSGGTLTVDGASTSMPGTPSTFTYGHLVVGHDGTGALTVSGGALAGGPIGSPAGTVTVAIGADATGSGAVTVDGASSTLKADVLSVGGVTGGAGTLTVSHGGTVVAADVTISATGTLVLDQGTLATDPLTLLSGSVVVATGEITGDILGDGGLTIGAGGTLALAGGVVAGTRLDFSLDGRETLVLATPGAVHGTIADFVAGDTTDLGQYATVSSSFVGGELIVDSGGNAVADLAFDGHYADGSVFAVVNSGIVQVETQVACYVAGTRIMTTLGAVEVEDLRAGDLVEPLIGGGTSPIRWIGQRSYAGRFLAANVRLQPIRFCAGSLGAGMPYRDLLVSPEHAMFLDGILIPARCLVNGTTILPERRLAQVRYFHIELAAHDVILAEGAPSETFRDDGSRGMFHNAASAPTPAPVAGGFCAPRIESGFAVEAVRLRLAAFARCAA